MRRSIPLLFQKYSEQKRIAPDQLEEKVKQWREEGKTIVTLNGSFDLMHAGHLQIIYEASQMGDILIVALNTDDSIKAYKSPSRPIVPLEYRLQMMSALGFVNYVTWFDETDPCAILSKIKPDVHVNGPDWGSDCIEAPTVKSFGGKIHIAQFIPSLSTTQIIKKIKECV